LKLRSKLSFVGIVRCIVFVRKVVLTLDVCSTLSIFFFEFGAPTHQYHKVKGKLPVLPHDSSLYNTAEIENG